MAMAGAPRTYKKCLQLLLLLKRSFYFHAANTVPRFFDCGHFFVLRDSWEEQLVEDFQLPLFIEDGLQCMSSHLELKIKILTASCAMRCCGHPRGWVIVPEGRRRGGGPWLLAPRNDGQ